METYESTSQKACACADICIAETGCRSTCGNGCFGKPAGRSLWATEHDSKCTYNIWHWICLLVFSLFVLLSFCFCLPVSLHRCVPLPIFRCVCLSPSLYWFLSVSLSWFGMIWKQPGITGEPQNVSTNNSKCASDNLNPSGDHGRAPKKQGCQNWQVVVVERIVGDTSLESFMLSVLIGSV